MSNMGSVEYPKVAEYFVVAGLIESSQPIDDELGNTSNILKIGDQRKDPITDICVIDKSLEESCPQGFTCIEQTPTGFSADLNHGSLSAHNMFLCYRRGKDKPPLIDVGVYYEDLETVKDGIIVIESTPAGRSANINNKTGIGSYPIYLTIRPSEKSAPQNLLVVTDLCVILTNKGERPPYAFCRIDKNLNKGLLGSNVYLCYKKSMRQVDSISYKAGIIDRYPRNDVGSFSLPATVPLFCLPMGATIECWSSNTKHPLPTFSSFVLTTEKSEKVFGAVISFYENYPENNLSNDLKYKLGLLRGDGLPSQVNKTIHTNKAICLLSRWPLFNAFLDFLLHLYRLTVSPQAHFVPIERYIAHFLHKVPFPTAQRPRVQYQLSPFDATILTRPQITAIPLSGASFLALLDDLGPENMITLLLLALTEQKIVIHSLRLAEITTVAEALVTLLFPFKWQCAYVPLCPLEMGSVMEAPLPFIVGVDSRYFDLFEPPPDVACVNLDTNSITIVEEKRALSWKLFPRKPARALRATLQRYSKELKDCPREKSLVVTAGTRDPDTRRTERHRRLELDIQEAVLKFMTHLMKGYRQYLLPITEAPSEGTTDPDSLFNIQEFVRSRDKASSRFFNMMVGTQLFSSFIEERSLTSVVGGGELAAGRSSSLVFFDECIDRISPDYENIRLIEGDDSLKSEHTVIIMAPDETGLPPGKEFTYTTFPRLLDELFVLDEEYQDVDSKQPSTPRPRRASDSFTFGRRTKQELRTMLKLAKMHYNDPKLWSRLLLSHAYGAWFACLPAFVMECRHKSAALRTAHDALHSLEKKKCFPLPDETFFRMLLHLCSTYNKPALAVRVYNFIRQTGTQLSAITYGLYNKAVLEGTWPTTGREGYVLWRKLRNVLLFIIKVRVAIFYNTDGHSREDDFSVEDGERRWSNGSDYNVPIDNVPENVEQKSDQQNESEAKLQIDEDNRFAGVHDHGYSSLPKEEVRRGSPLQKSPSNPEVAKPGKSNHQRSNSIETNTDSVISSTDANDTPKSISLEKNLPTRNVQPPSTLDLPPRVEDKSSDRNFPSDLGMRSDDTLVNGENGQGDGVTSHIDDNLLDNRQFKPQISSLQRLPDRELSGSIDGALLNCDSGDHGDFSFALMSVASEMISFTSERMPQLTLTASIKPNVINPNLESKTVTELNTLTSLKYRNNVAASPISRVNGNALANGNVPFVAVSPLVRVPNCDAPASFIQSAPSNSAFVRVVKDPGVSPVPTPSAAEDVVFSEKSFASTATVEAKHKDDTKSSTSLSKQTARDSPVTPEMANTFKSDSKFLLGLSDSDQRRLQELSRPASFDPDIAEHRSTRHGSLLFSSKASKFRSSSVLFPGSGRISPSVRDLSLGDRSNPNTPVTRNNFDNLTAEDFMSSPSRSIAGRRSISGSILANPGRSPSRIIHDSPNRRSSKKLAGSNSLILKDGVAMLTSTPLRDVPEPVINEENISEKTSASEKETIRNLNASERKKNSVSTRSSMRLSRHESIREDISHLLADPLSASIAEPSSDDCFTSLDPLSKHAAIREKKSSSTNVSSSTLNRNLVDEILENENDLITRSSSDAALLQEQKKRLGKSNDSAENDLSKNKLRRKSSLPSSSPASLQRNTKPPLQRSMTRFDNIANPSSTGWFTSGSKLNNFMKVATMGVASKAKKAASNFAKDINETMQASLAYYAHERVKGSHSDLSLRSSQEDALSKASFEALDGKKKSSELVVDHLGSQTSLRSADSVRSSLEPRNSGLDKIPRRKGNNKNMKRLDRPLSVPHFDSSKGRFPPSSNSLLSQTGSGNESSNDPFMTASTASLNSKASQDIEVIISSCSRCTRCNCLVYDEEIMAGWFADDSNLNTHCPFCNALFVPILNIEITDFRSFDDTNSSVGTSAKSGSASTPQTVTFQATFALAEESSLNQQNQSSAASEHSNPSPTTSKSVSSPQSTSDDKNILTIDLNETMQTKSFQESSAKDKRPKSDILVSKANNDLIKHSRSNVDSQEYCQPLTPTIIEPIAVPYLSPLVLRKELESLLENEGNVVLTQPQFVDHHPIIYWNLFWYFWRLGLHSNLFDLLPKSNLLAEIKFDPAAKARMQISLMWDNLKLHDSLVKPPLYCSKLHMMSTAGSEDDFAYPSSFLDEIIKSITDNDVRGPLVAVLSELNVQRDGIRRSAYREILYLVLVALGKSCIDIDAFDREYKRAYQALTNNELTMAMKCDRPPNLHSVSARNMFGALDLVK